MPEESAFRAVDIWSNHGRATVTLNGALSWPGREVLRCTADMITAAKMIVLFDELQERHPTASAANIVLDNATYIRAAAVREWLAQPGCRMRLVYLPPYAPNLNLIAQLWWFLKEKALWNTGCPTFTAYRSAIERFFGSLIIYRFHVIGSASTQFPSA